MSRAFPLDTKTNHSLPNPAKSSKGIMSGLKKFGRGLLDTAKSLGKLCLAPLEIGVGAARFLSLGIVGNLLDGLILNPIVLFCANGEENLFRNSLLYMASLLGYGQSSVYPQSFLDRNNNFYKDFEKVLGVGNKRAISFLFKETYSLWSEIAIAAIGHHGHHRFDHDTKLFRALLNIDKLPENLQKPIFEVWLDKDRQNRLLHGAETSDSDLTRIIKDPFFHFYDYEPQRKTQLISRAFKAVGKESSAIVVEKFEELRRECITELKLDPYTNKKIEDFLISHVLKNIKNISENCLNIMKIDKVSKESPCDVRNLIHSFTTTKFIPFDTNLPLLVTSASVLGDTSKDYTLPHIYQELVARAVFNFFRKNNEAAIKKAREVVGELPENTLTTEAGAAEGNSKDQGVREEEVLLGTAAGVEAAEGEVSLREVEGAGVGLPWLHPKNPQPASTLEGENPNPNLTQQRQSAP